MIQLLACLTLLAAVAPSFAPAPAQAGAAFYGLTFAGTIGSFSPELDDGTFQVGAEVTGFVRIDAGVADSEPSPGIGRYELAASDVFIALGDYHASAPNGFLFLRDGDNAIDEFYVEAPVSGTPVGGVVPFRLILDLTDTTQTALPSDAIPSSLDRADFSSAFALLHFEGGDVDPGVEMPITSLSYVPAPEPGGALLAATGALTLATLRPRTRGSRVRSAP
jgi:hypothetical protein